MSMPTVVRVIACCSASNCIGGCTSTGNHLTPGVTEVRSYAAFFTSFLAEGLRVRFREIPALNTS